MDAEQKKLHRLFLRGKAPRRLTGFYRGSVSLLIPTTPLEYLAKFAISLYLPWFGKVFIHEGGDNIVSTVPAVVLKYVYPGGKSFIFGPEHGGTHAFHFTTLVTKSLMHDLNVFQLNYDLPENPPVLRRIVDEVVEIEKDVLLGTASIYNATKELHTIAYFKLRKS